VAAALSEIGMEPGELSQAIKSDPAKILESDATRIDPAKFMERELAHFRDAKLAVEHLKTALASLISTLRADGAQPPVFVIIDEIDRCRPTYAIKLFEEIKHLLDVDGLVFVFGTNQRALAKSVAGAYGPEFDGWLYLRRLINRTYRLKEPNLEPLIESIFHQLKIPLNRLAFPTLVIGANRGITIPASRVVADYMKMYDRQPRDAYFVVETLQTCLALTGSEPLMLGYLLPLILSSMMETYTGGIIEPESWGTPWSINTLGGPINAADYARKIRTYSGQSARDLMGRINSGTDDGVAIDVFKLIYEGDKSRFPELANPREYPKLLQTVARFD
jgi:hypothetical protein